jgi:hypothetical protein
MGGYWLGGFTIAEQSMTHSHIINFFNVSIGRRVVEKSASIITWEGEIVQMDLAHNGLNYRRTLDYERWHNRVKVAYTDASTAVATATAWSENTGSSDIYGESNYIDVVGDNYDATSAVALRDRRLAEHAYPRPFPEGGFASQDAGERGTSLNVMTAGYVFGMNRRFRESDTAAGNVSAQISTLIGESEFVTTGHIEANTLQVPISGSEISFRIWDGVSDMIEMGDASGNRWTGGCWAGRKFHYEQAETMVTHYWRGSKLRDLAQQPVQPSLIKPDIIVQISDLPVGILPPGGNVWDNPRNVYIEEVEFIAPDQYRLIPYTEE